MLKIEELSGLPETNQEIQLYDQKTFMYKEKKRERSCYLLRVWELFRIERDWDVASYKKDKKNVSSL